MAANLYTEQERNVKKTWFLMTSFLVLVIFLGWSLSYFYGEIGIFYIAIFFSLGMNLVSYYKSDKIALAVSHAKPADENEYKELYRLVENLCIAAGLKKPRLYIIEDDSPNAFATGRNQDNAAIAVTTGLLKILDRSELEGVLAHELAHIGNRDILLQTIVVVLVGIVTLLSDIFIRSRFRVGRDRDSDQIGVILVVAGVVMAILSPLVATAIQLAISRKREFLADATGSLITRYPDGLASALEKISGYGKGIKAQNHATAHLFITSPLGGDLDHNGIPDYKEGKKRGFFNKLFSTHPPVEERISALRGLKI